MQHLKVISVWLAGLLLLSSCTTVPLTNRSQLNLIPDAQVLSLSFDQYQQFLEDHEVITGTPEADMVVRVGTNIRRAVADYLRNQGRSGLLNGYAWEFKLVADDKINAFAMPGGKVVIFEGIMDIARNESGLATVMGHEIAHAIARHGNERMSQSLVTQLGGMALDLALNDKPQQTRQLYMAAYGMGTQVGLLLPYSRLQESEADRLGLIFMAMAGYDPREAVAFWQRMERKSQSGAPPEFLSTHPSHQTRIADLEGYMPVALQYYHK